MNVPTGQLRADIRADMAEQETRIVTKPLVWLVGLSLAQILATVGVGVFS